MITIIENHHHKKTIIETLGSIRFSGF